MKARPYYEKIEPVAESFTIGKDNLDADIDARAGDVPASQWTGFHRIEKGLFQAKSLTGLARRTAPGWSPTSRSCRRSRPGLTYQPSSSPTARRTCSTRSPARRSPARRSATPTSTCSTSRPTTKAPSRRSPSCSRAWRRSTPALATTIATAVHARWTRSSTSTAPTPNPSGFVLYTALTTADKQKLAAAVKAVQEPLSQVASKVANA